MKMNPNAGQSGFTGPLSSSKPLFYPGYVSLTGTCLQTLDAYHLSPFEALARHIRGDWGDVSNEVRAQNARALAFWDEEGSRICSVYRLSKDVRIWIISEYEWASVATAIMLPGEAPGLSA